MNITVSGRQIRLTEDIKGYIDLKLNMLEKYLDPTSQVKVTLSENKDMQKVEVTIMPANGPIIRAEQVQDNLFVAMDIVYEKIFTQIEKYRNRSKYKLQNNKNIMQDDEYTLSEDFYYLDDENRAVIERRKKFSVKPMSAQEAILQMELIGHKFYMFRNQYTYEINVVYKRENGGYGVIEHE